MVIRTTATDKPADPLDALAMEAEGMGAASAGAGPGDGGGPGDGSGEDGPQRLTNAQCLAMAIQMIRETLCLVARVESPKRTIDDGTAQTVADALAPVLDKYGVNLSSVAGDYMIEIRAAIVTVPVILAARRALLEEIRAKNAKPVNPEPEPVAEAAAQ